MSWTLTANDSQFFSDVKIYEGSKEFQTAKGMFKNGKFWTYKDSLGLPTIGYGHLIRQGENFSNGLTEAEAEALLQKDALNAYKDAKSIYEQYGMNGPVELQRVLWQMTFQMGKSSVLNFRKALVAMGKGDYKTAGREMRDSRWYRQTTSRAEKMARIVEGLQ
jgi:Phage lysozyme.